ncbi:MAG: protein kinase [Acidobacteria bacterium]|nr:protein kinase [Acidobacteriota bacterium]
MLGRFILKSWKALSPWRLAWVWSFLGCLVLSSPVVALDPNKAITEYGFFTWQEELPQNSVHRLAQTPDGYLWFSTYEGLVRFDGVQFTVFDTRNTPELKSNSVGPICVGLDGTLWAVSSTGLLSYRNHRFTSYTTEDGLPHKVTQDVYTAQDGSIWVNTFGGYAVIRNGKISSFPGSLDILNQHSVMFGETEQGLLAFTPDVGIVRVTPSETVKISLASEFDALADNQHSCLFQDRDGTLWGANLGKLHHLVNGKVTTYTVADGLLPLQISVMYRDRDGNLWMGFEGGGLGRLTAGHFTYFSQKDGLTNDLVRTIYEDQEGNLWVGTTGGGLNCFKDEKFTVYNKRHGLADNNVRVVLEDRQGNLWIGTNGNGLNCLKPDRSVVTYTAETGLLNNFIRSLAEDHTGAIWVGFNGSGVVRIANGQVTSFQGHPGQTQQPVYAILEDRHGTMWFGTRAGGLTRYENGTFRTYTTADGLAHNSVVVLVEDKIGDGLWVGSFLGLHYFKDETFRVWHSQDGMPDDTVRSLAVDSAGTVWVSTNGGLARLKNGRMTPITTRNGLADNAVFSMLEDRSGYLWMSSNRGISRVRKQDIEDFCDGKRPSFTHEAFTRDDGMRNNQCNGIAQPAAICGRDGRFWFAGVAGLITIHPDHILRNPVPPPIAVEQVLVDGKSVDLAASVELAPGADKLEFRYTALSFLAPAKVRFKVMLEGYDRAWIETGDQRRIGYTNLPPRSYRFRVLACNNDGVWNETGAAFTFRIRPHWYQTPWAYLAGFALIAGSVYGGVRLRLRALNRRAAQLEAVVVERTAELATKNAELAENIEQVRLAKLETERKNTELDQKVAALDRANQDLIISHQQADRIFSALAEALPGTVLEGKYRLEEKIGSGGFGAVFRGTHLVLHRPIAVKVFRPAPGNDSADAVERFRLEGVSSSRINHPNAIQVFDSGISAEGIAYLVMELLDGCSLSEELHIRKRLSLRRTLRVMRAVCEGLAEAHRLGIIHRDIKPANIFLHRSPEGEVVKVVDFGVAKMLDDSEASGKKLTVTGGIVGTPTYMAPERLWDGTYDGRSDIYSVGIMFYECLCGRPPFVSENNSAYHLIVAHLNELPPSLRSINPTIPPEVDAAVLKALVKQPEARPTAREFADLLRALTEQFAEYDTDDEVEGPHQRLADQPTVALDSLQQPLDMPLADQVTQIVTIPSRSTAETSLNNQVTGEILNPYSSGND